MVTAMVAAVAVEVGKYMAEKSVVILKYANEHVLYVLRSSEPSNRVQGFNIFNSSSSSS